MVDTLILLFNQNETKFTSNGLGNLTDAERCRVIEERNGSFELELTYPITGIHYSDIGLRKIIFAKPNPFADKQPFRIYSISKPLNGLVTISAEHISYDLSGYPVEPFTATNPNDAFDKIKSNSIYPCPFTFSTDKSNSATMKIDKPSSLRSLLGGSEGSILDVYGGEYVFDKYKVTLKQHRGNSAQDPSEFVKIQYGKNLTSVKQEENCNNVYTGVTGFWYSDADDGGLVMQTVSTPGTFNFTRVLTLDMTSYFDEKPTAAQLNKIIEQYIEDNEIGKPKVSLDVSFIQLSQFDEYKDIALLERVHLCDSVVVEFPELNVNSTAKVTKTIYDVLTDTYESLELGTTNTLAQTILDNTTAIQAATETTKTELERAIERATKLITGNLGGYVVFHNSGVDEFPDEILIMDKPDINQATKVWRWNLSGLGYSNTGYNGTFDTAITMDGEIVAKYITSGEMSANRVRGGQFIVGGYDGQNGVILAKDKDGNVKVQIDQNGITLQNGTYITWDDISGKPNDIVTGDNLSNYNIVTQNNMSAYRIVTGDNMGDYSIITDSNKSSYITKTYIDDLHVIAENIAATRLAGKILYGGKAYFGNFDDGKVNYTGIDDTGMINLYSSYSSRHPGTGLPNVKGIGFKGRAYTNDSAKRQFIEEGYSEAEAEEMSTTWSEEGWIGFINGYEPYFSGTSKYAESAYADKNTAYNRLVYTTQDGEDQIRGLTIEPNWNYMIAECYSSIGKWWQYAIAWELSDERLKKNIKDSDLSGLDFVDKLHHVEFDWNEKANKNGHVNIGYIAQEVEELDPSCVYKVVQHENSEFDDIYQMNDHRLIPYLSKAIQELHEIVKKQSEEIAYLKKKLEEE